MSLINLNLIRVDDNKNNNNNNNRDDHISRDDREDERDADNNNDSIEYLCKKCYIFHQFDNEHCSNKDEICDNDDCANSRNHKELNCTWSKEDRYKEWIVEKRKNNISTITFDFSTITFDFFIFFTLKVHIEII